LCQIAYEQSFKGLAISRELRNKAKGQELTTKG
jgi:hypothetical protein